MSSASSGSGDKFDDEHYPAYTMGRAAEMIGVTPAFLRSIEHARLFEPLRSEGGHRRYSRYQLRLAARVREIADQGTGIEAACRIVILEDQLAEAQRINSELRRNPGQHAAGSGRDIDRILSRTRTTARRSGQMPFHRAQISYPALEAQGFRSGRKAARSSEANSSGSSQAAKWPPLSTSLKYARPG
jgi:DNA-binding transcriptional MerR regulator